MRIHQEIIHKIRFGDSIICPICSSFEISNYCNRYECKKCRKNARRTRFNEFTFTSLHQTKLSCEELFNLTLKYVSMSSEMYPSPIIKVNERTAYLFFKNLDALLIKKYTETYGLINHINEINLCEVNGIIKIDQDLVEAKVRFKDLEITSSEISNDFRDFLYSQLHNYAVTPKSRKAYFVHLYSGIYLYNEGCRNVNSKVHLILKLLLEPLDTLLPNL